MIALPTMDIATIRKYISETQDILLRFCLGYFRQPAQPGGFALMTNVEDSGQRMKMLHLIPQVILLSVAVDSAANSATCLAPQRPFVPNDPIAVVEFADLIRQDFESYITDIQRYFRCLEDERARAFEEARLVSQDYGAFVSGLGKD